MALTILDMPNAPSGIARVQFEIERVDYAAPEASGRQGGVQAGWPLWSAKFDLDRSDPDSADLWNSFLSRLRGRQRLFLAGDPTRAFPKSAPGGFDGMSRGSGGLFTGAALGWSQAFDAGNNALLGLAGLPANFVLSHRDFIGFKWDAAGVPAGSFGRRTIARVVQPAIANAAGAVTVMIEPPIDPLVVPAGAVAHLDQPLCLMRQIPEQTNIGPIGGGGAMGGGTITGIQELRP
jgi:hypothetical protein